MKNIIIYPDLWNWWRVFCWPRCWWLLMVWQHTFRNHFWVAHENESSGFQPGELDFYIVWWVLHYNLSITYIYTYASPTKWMGSLILRFVLLYMEINDKTATHDCFVGYPAARDWPCTMGCDVFLISSSRMIGAIYKVHTQLIRKTEERVTRGRVLAVGQWVPDGTGNFWLFAMAKNGLNVVQWFTVF